MPVVKEAFSGHVKCSLCLQVKSLDCWAPTEPGKARSCTCCQVTLTRRQVRYRLGSYFSSVRFLQLTENIRSEQLAARKIKFFCAGADGRLQHRISPHRRSSGARGLLSPGEPAVAPGHSAGAPGDLCCHQGSARTGCTRYYLAVSPASKWILF